MRVFICFLLLVHTPIPPSRKDEGSFHFQGMCHVIEQTTQQPMWAASCEPETAQCSTGGADGQSWVFTEENTARGKGRKASSLSAGRKQPPIIIPLLILSGFEPVSSPSEIV